MRPINRCLNKQLVTLCQQVMQLDSLNSKLAQFIPAHLQPHCYAGSFNKGCLLLITDDAVWATEIRYIIPELRDYLRKEAGLYQLININVHVTQSQDVKNTRKPLKGQPISPKTRHTIRNIGDLCHYSPLKEALYRLADEP
ncbi:Zn-ribbon-containing, possible RNA-binding protein-like protein [Legionella beliardensis]|uniref:Zn-ribbon-containing, possible RNA-binding protein-like protein n=1 Tax=Legionella beliardensis TaxID=91822 RepID=A0A378ICG8_9GAMM|nr:DUF721 domain-containing protein [Legionella beliardensis]STX29994.1 Zn-ribbon-containing, possible RNA-binding protein-like protein [Legionella beliardensis]